MAASKGATCQTTAVRGHCVGAWKLEYPLLSADSALVIVACAGTLAGYRESG